MKSIHFLLLSFLFPSVIVLSTIGCGTAEVKNFDEALTSGTDFELFSLDPSMLDKEEREKILADSPDALFQDWKIIGSTKITNEGIRNSLLKALAKAEAENDRVAGCFNPRHGIRVTYDDKQYNYAICFECYQIYQYIDGIRGKYIKTTSTPRKVFNEVLTNAEVALPNH